MKKLIYFALLSILLCGCAKGSMSPLDESVKGTSGFSDNKKQIRRTGDLNITIKNANKTRKAIYTVCEKYKAKIMQDNIRTETNNTQSGFFQIRVDKDDFFTVMDEIKKIGEIRYLNIYEADESYNIEKLQEEINSPDNDNDEKRELKKRLKETREGIDYSIIYIRYKEKPSLFNVISEGFSEGIEVAGSVTEAVVIIFFGLIPLLFLAAFLLTFYSFFRWHWKLFLVKIENIIGKKARQKYLKERK
ncbi:MAG: DUF4349 domain-containing protein [Spirochaetes bacterium]|nr:DUF4349 domain-containing protein [Spirochaetota bacterium]MBN2772137.1 DUF4349 domain-containing protein [Spirochaetota bacterium]